MSGNIVDDHNKIDKCRRRFLLRLTQVMGGLGAVFASIPFITAWWPSARTKALGAPIEVDISGLKPGDMMTVSWRQHPIWVVRRTPQMLSHLLNHNNSLRDPNSLVDQQPSYAQNPYRSLTQEYFIAVGVCTHLGCIPSYKPNLNEIGPNWPGGFYCPCHGSKFDLAGRVYKNVPAPINLEIPHYRFVNEHTIVIGEDPHHV